jgi:hypothetical protein
MEDTAASKADQPQDSPATAEATPHGAQESGDAAEATPPPTAESDDSKAESGALESPKDALQPLIDKAASGGFYQMKKAMRQICFAHCSSGAKMTWVWPSRRCRRSDGV